MREPIHLAKRDRIALSFRVSGSVLGFAVIIVGFASSWSRPWIMGLFAAITVGGALSYHVLTSVVRCPSCSGRVANFRIASPDEKRKTFSCAACGTSSWMREGFYWHSEING